MLSLWLNLCWAQEPAPSAPADQQAEEAAEGELVKLPELLEFIQAPYPPEAQEAGLEGVVRLLIEIDETGVVSSAEVLEGPGQGFDEAALKAVQEFVFSPAEDSQGPIAVQLEFEYGFALDVQEDPEQELEAPVNLEVEVFEMGTGAPLEQAAIQVAGTDPVIQGEADDKGRIELRGVPAGSWELVVARPGWDTRRLSVEIVEGEVTTVKAWIKRIDYGNDEAVGLYRKVTEEISQRSISMEEVRRIPGSFGDPVRVIQSLPGAARAPFGSGVLVIRGSNPEDSAVYVEGIRIPLIYHLGGYVSVINPDLVEGVEYLPGGYGVQYGRSTGGVVDVQIKEEAPERHRVSWSTDLLDSGGLYEGRLGESEDHHVGLAARRSYIDAVLAGLDGLTSVSARPVWMDYQARYHYSGWDGDRSITAFLFGFQDSLLISTPDDVAQGTDQDFQGDLGLQYGTHRFLIKYEQALGERWRLRAIPSIGYDFAYTGVGQSFELTQTQVLPEVRVEFPWQPSERLLLTPGVDFIGGWSDFTLTLPFNPDSFVEYDPLGEREDATLSGDPTGWGPDLYLKANWRPLEDPEALQIVPGIRATTVWIPDSLTVFGVDPRVAFRAKVLPGGTLKGGTGIYNQPPQPFESWTPFGEVDLDMERAWATALGWEQEFMPGLEADAEVFYKHLTGLIVANQGVTDLSDQLNINAGIGRVYGSEFMLRKAATGPLFGWLSYTLSKSERVDYPDPETGLLFSEVPEDSWYDFDFDQTHILVAVAGWKLPRAFELSGRYQYVTGNPYTPISGGVYDIDQDFYYGFSAAERNRSRLPSFQALDLRFSKKLVFKRGWLELYLDALNTYKGENPEFVNYNYDYSESTFVSGLPFIPSPGFALEFNL